MNLSTRIFQESQFGVDTLLECSGTALENPFVYDSVARDLKLMANEGLVDICEVQMAEGYSPPIIQRLTFKRLR